MNLGKKVGFQREIFVDCARVATNRLKSKSYKDVARVKWHIIVALNVNRVIGKRDTKKNVLKWK